MTDRDGKRRRASATPRKGKRDVNATLSEPKPRSATGRRTRTERRSRSRDDAPSASKTSSKASPKATKASSKATKTSSKASTPQRPQPNAPTPRALPPPVQAAALLVALLVGLGVGRLSANSTPPADAGVSTQLAATSDPTPPKQLPPQQPPTRNSKSPTHRALPALPVPGWPSFDERDPHLLIASWNLRRLGNRSTEGRNFDKLTQVVGAFDLIALQELESPEHLDSLERITAALAEYGRSYEFWISPETGYQDNDDSSKNSFVLRSGFIWDSSRLRLKRHPRALRDTLINDDVFREVPFAADFEVVAGNGFDFRITSVHTVYSQDLSHVRRGEIEFLRDWILESARGREQNVMAVGDFNSDPPNQPQRCRYFTDLLADSGLRVLFQEPELAQETPVRTTVPRKDSSENPDYFLAPVYDHVLISPATSYALPANPMTFAESCLGVLQFDMDPWWNQAVEDRNDIVDAMADHRPIWFRLDYYAEDRD